MLKCRRPLWLLAAMVVALLVATAACGEEETRPGEVVWGWMFELSGPLQGFGEPTGDGVKLAVQEINQAGGFQVPEGGRQDYANRIVTAEDILRKDPEGGPIYTIKLLEHDTRSDIANTVAIATQLVRDDKVKVIWGPATTGEPQATQITQPHGVLHLCPCQNRETIALRTVEQARGESRWAFQTLLPFSLLIDQAARGFVEDWPDMKTFAILCVNTEVGRDVCSRFKEAYQRVGLRLVGEEFFPPLTTDYSPFLTRLKGADPDYVFNFDDPLQQASIVRQALELGVGRLHNANLPANLVEGAIGRPLDVPVIAGAAPRQHVQPTSEAARAYFERYRAFKGGTLPLAPFVSLLTYDFVYMLVAAMQQAGTVEDTTKIAEALEGIHYKGVAEDDLFFNSRHLAVHGTDPCIVRPGGQITCEHVPPPPEAAQ